MSRKWVTKVNPQCLYTLYTHKMFIHTFIHLLICRLYLCLQNCDMHIKGLSRKTEMYNGLPIYSLIIINDLRICFLMVNMLTA